MAKRIESTPLSQLGDFNRYLKHTFIIRKNNEEKMVKIVKVRGNKVQLRSATDERANAFTISQAEFMKYYELVTGSKPVSAGTLAEEYKYDASSHVLDTTTKHYIPVVVDTDFVPVAEEANHQSLRRPQPVQDEVNTRLVVEYDDIPGDGEVVAHPRRIYRVDLDPPPIKKAVTEGATKRALSGDELLDKLARSRIDNPEKDYLDAWTRGDKEEPVVSTDPFAGKLATRLA
jgi:hypothetical protein